MRIGEIDDRRKHQLETELERVNEIRRSDVLPEVWPFVQRYAAELRERLRKLAEHKAA
jgi:hypothetical protein